jgi:hypothetical protein
MTKAPPPGGERAGQTWCPAGIEPAAHGLGDCSERDGEGRAGTKPQVDAVRVRHAIPADIPSSPEFVVVQRLDGGGNRQGDGLVRGQAILSECVEGPSADAFAFVLEGRLLEHLVSRSHAVPPRSMGEPGPLLDRRSVCRVDSARGDI